jgi:DNA-directed RNA polymerase subunit N (RpoN/RPB10)
MSRGVALPSTARDSARLTYSGLGLTRCCCRRFGWVTGMQLDFR